VGATAAALAASARPAAPGRAQQHRYDVSLTGSQRTVVTRTGTTTNASGCTVRTADRDSRTIVFSSRRRLSLALGSELPLLRFALTARVQGTYHRRATLVDSTKGCSAPPPKDSSCGPARVPARLTVRSARRKVHLAGGFARRRDRDRCATTLTSPDRFVVPSDSRLTRSPKGAPRVFVHGHLVERTTVGSVVETTIVDWRLTLRRV
jgi:hypothetical protein